MRNTNDSEHYTKIIIAIQDVNLGIKVAMFDDCV